MFNHFNIAKTQTVVDSKNYSGVGIGMEERSKIGKNLRLVKPRLDRSSSQHLDMAQTAYPGEFEAYEERAMRKVCYGETA